MRPVSEVLSGKSFNEQIQFMLENPPALQPGTSFAGDERCPSCGGLIHDASRTEGARCRCAGALTRCLEYVDRADPQGRMTFEGLKEDPAQARAVAAAKRVAVGKRRGLALFGPPGTGKTHVAVAACRLPDG